MSGDLYEVVGQLPKPIPSSQSIASRAERNPSPAPPGKRTLLLSLLARRRLENPRQYDGPTFSLNNPGQPDRV